MDRLPEIARENVFLVLEDVRFGNRIVHVDGSKDEDNLGRAAALLRVSTEGPRLILDLLSVAGELVRKNFVHEFTHLLRFVTNGPLHETLGRVRSLQDRRFGIYREEIWAFREEYRYLHRTYTRADLPRLNQRTAERDALKEDLKNLGVLSAKGTEMDGDRLRDEEVLILVIRFFAADEDADLHDHLAYALDHTESQFVKNYVKFYQAEQYARHMQIALNWRNWFKGRRFRTNN